MEKIAASVDAGEGVEAEKSLQALGPQSKGVMVSVLAEFEQLVACSWHHEGYWKATFGILGCGRVEQHRCYGRSAVADVFVVVEQRVVYEKVQF